MSTAVAAARHRSRPTAANGKVPRHTNGKPPAGGEGLAGGQVNGQPPAAGKSAAGKSPAASKPAAAGQPRNRRAWAPDHDDHFIYKAVKFDGMTQSWVAGLLQINQSTVSRVIQRYERWQAHASPRDQGRLEHAERLRVQHWLTFERNEQILCSCLRIATEMEREGCVTTTTTSRPLSQPDRERELRQQSANVDRHGVASRFLRLAFRINMEQLKLVQADEPPLPPPLSDDEIAEEEQAAAAFAAEFRGHRKHPGQGDERQASGDSGREAGVGEQEAELIERLQRQEELERAELAQQLEAQLAQRSTDQPITDQPAADVHNLHNLHSPCTEENDASDCDTSTCDESHSAEKIANPACTADAAPRVGPAAGEHSPEENERRAANSELLGVVQALHEQRARSTRPRQPR